MVLAGSPAFFGLGLEVGGLSCSNLLASTTVGSKQGTREADRGLHRASSNVCLFEQLPFLSPRRDLCDHVVVELERTSETPRTLVPCQAAK